MSTIQEESVEQATPDLGVALEELRSQLKELQAEQAETRQQLLKSLQKLMSLQKLTNQGRSGTGPTLSTRGTETEPEAARSRDPPARCPEDHHDCGEDNDPQTSGLEAPEPTSRIGSNIPDLDDLDRRILRSTQRPAKTRENRRDRVLPAIPQPKQEPPELLIAHGPSECGLMRRRGSAFKHLARDSQAQILARTAPTGPVCTIFDNIGVSLWLGWRNFTTFTIVMMGLFYLVLTVTSYICGLQQAGEQWTALSLLLFSTGAILLLQQVKRSLYSADLHMALQKLDDFVQDCGQGLDWASVARKYWCHFVFLWALASLEFIVQQVLEETAKDTHTLLSILQAIASCFLFSISSAVVMSGVYLQFNLLLGVGKALDCWCADIAETQDFVSGVQTWNSLQAWLKCVGREITPCFTSVILLGYVGFFVAITGCIVVLLADGLEVWRVLLYASSLLPLLYLCYLSVRLFAQGASLSERCKQIPAFVNQLSMRHDGADTDRKYLVQYISNSAAGFIVHGVTLSQSVLVEQMFWVAAVCSGIMGVLLRRYP